MVLFRPHGLANAENCFYWHGAKPGMQVVLGFAGSAGLATSLGVLSVGAWFQMAAALVFALVSAITILNHQKHRRIKQAALILVIKPDGNAVTRENFSSPVTETLLTVRFAWRGQRSARLVFLLPDGKQQHWYLYRRDLNASQWRCLCRWIIWLGRGQKPV